LGRVTELAEVYRYERAITNKRLDCEGLDVRSVVAWSGSPVEFGPRDAFGSKLNLALSLRAYVDVDEQGVVV
jgi:hypothetical protein